MPSGLFLSFLLSRIRWRSICTFLAVVTTSEESKTVSRGGWEEVVLSFLPTFSWSFSRAIFWQVVHFLHSSYKLKQQYVTLIMRQDTYTATHLFNRAIRIVVIIIIVSFSLEVDLHVFCGASERGEQNSFAGWVGGSSAIFSSHLSVIFLKG